MILKKLVVQSFGPFHFPTEILIDEQVTVLTGQNDVGKSALLRLLYLICKNETVTQDDVNIERIYEADVSWERDGEVKCIATFSLKENMGLYQSNTWTAGTEIDVEYSLSLNHRIIVAARNPSGGNIPVKQPGLSNMPSVVYLPYEGVISSEIDGNTQNPLEADFLTLAFGANYLQKLEKLDPARKRTEVRAANGRINQKLQDLLPYNLGLEFVIDLFSETPLKFSINFRDKFGGDTPLHMRGAGVRKMVTLVVSLLRVFRREEKRYVYVLFDEPETSLHADSQHLVRTLLESLAANEYIQVIYATHSPSMINPLRANSIRLLKRIQRDGIATATADNRPIDENFLPVRISLGLTASDSLLYAPITFIVEGITEVVSLPLLLKRLYDAGIEGFEETAKLLPLCHFLDGQGDSFEYLCRLAKSQGCKPIIFVDGDKLRRIKQLKLEEKHPDVPVIHLKANEEFEQIFPQETYFEALEKVLGKTNLESSYIEWEGKGGFPERLVFSKRVDRWLQDTFDDVDLDKPEVMRQAIEMVDLAVIKIDPFKQLVKSMKQLLEN